jgi:hypothetical protein
MAHGRRVPFRARIDRGIVPAQYVIFTTPCPTTRCGLSRRTRERTYLPRAYMYVVVSCGADAGTRRNREGLARAPPLEGHDGERALTHSHHPIVGSSAFEKILSLPILFGFWKDPREGFGQPAGKVCASAGGQKRHTLFNALGPCVFHKENGGPKAAQ